MTALLIDTHVLAWALTDPDRISAEARRLLLDGRAVLVAPCSFHEIALKVRNGKWPEMAKHCADLVAHVDAAGLGVVRYDARMALAAGAMAWAHRDPFDRMIAATAIEIAAPLVSRDAQFDALGGTAGWLRRIPC